MNRAAIKTTSELKQTFTDNLRSLRYRDNLSQMKLSERLSIPQKKINSWELNHSFPNIGDVLRICDYFNVTIEKMLLSRIDTHNRGELSEDWKIFKMTN